jgi:hypothetical protein
MIIEQFAWGAKGVLHYIRDGDFHKNSKEVRVLEIHRDKKISHIETWILLG